MSMTFADHLTEHQRHAGYITTSSYGVEAARLRECVQAYRASGGIEISDGLGARTASGLRTQNIEIKYKKPTSAARELVRRRRSKNPHKCGEEGPQMIRRDSFGTSSGMSDRSCRRSGAAPPHCQIRRTILPCTRTTANCVGNASNLNCFESLVVFLWGVPAALPATSAWNGTNTTSVNMGGGGYQISGSFGAVTARGATRRFFFRAEEV